MSTIGVIVEDEKSHDMMEAGLQVLDAVCRKYSLDIRYKDLWVGETSVKKYGMSLTEATERAAVDCDNILAVSSKRGDLQSLELVQKLHLCYNYRWAHSFRDPAFPDSGKDAPSKLDIFLVSDIMNTTGKEEQTIYVDNGIIHAHDSIKVSELYADLVIRNAFDIAGERRGGLTYVDRANILHTSKLWRMLMDGIKARYTGVSYSEMLIEDFLTGNFCNFKDMDVILANSYLADILSAYIASVAGFDSLANVYVNKEGFGIYGVYQSTDNERNPLGFLISVAMMLQYAFKNTEAATDVIQAVTKVAKKVSFKEDASLSALEFGASVAGEIG